MSRHIKMELTNDKKRKIINNVQVRINKWIGRPYLTIHEAIILNAKHCPFKIQFNPPLMGFITNYLGQSKIRYSELYSLIKETDVETAEENLFRYAIENYLTYCFGG